MLDHLGIKCKSYWKSKSHNPKFPCYTIQVATCKACFLFYIQKDERNYSIYKTLDRLSDNDTTLPVPSDRNFISCLQVDVFLLLLLVTISFFFQLAQMTKWAPSSLLGPLAKWPGPFLSLFCHSPLYTLPLWLQKYAPWPSLLSFFQTPKKNEKCSRLAIA